MRKKYVIYAFSFLLLTIVIGSSFGLRYVFASPSSQAAVAVNAGKAASAQPLAHYVVDMQHIPMAAGQATSNTTGAVRSRTGIAAKTLGGLVAAAAHNPKAPVAGHSYTDPSGGNAGVGKYTPAASKAFQGLSQVCCQPPDHALAASPSWVFQGVNLQFAVYSPAGALQAGWPKNTASFFGVPSPGACSPTPFMSDPRAFYDFTDKRFWAAALEAEGATNNCPLKSLYWIAVSKTSNPNGLWNIYAFDMALGSNNSADFTQFGFDGQAIYFSGNMFSNAGRGGFAYSEVFAALKAPMEAGAGVSYFGFIGQTVGGVPVDTVQPVESMEYGYGGPRAGFFINSFNINFGGVVCSSGCSGVVVWALGNPGQSTDFMTGVVVSTSGYILSPSADQPGCVQCVPASDTRISGTPIYHNGLISFALETGINNGSQIVPGIFWGQVNPVIDDSGSLLSANVYQSGYYNYAGDSAATYPVLMTDAGGNLFMLFEFMSSSANPGTVYTARRATFAPGFFHDGGIYLRSGDAATSNFRWGDYEAASYDGYGSDKVWFAGEYSTSAHTWSTFIGTDRFSLANP